MKKGRYKQGLNKKRNGDINGILALLEYSLYSTFASFVARKQSKNASISINTETHRAGVSIYVSRLGAGCMR